MHNFERGERHKINFKFLLDLIRSNLEKCYKKITPELELSDFNSQLLNVVELRDDPAVVDLIEIIAQFVPEELRKNENDWIARSPHGPIIVSCAYRSRAIKAMMAVDPDTAWSYLADAMYWCGISVSGLSLEELRKNTIVEMKKSFAKSGGKAKDQKTYESLRQHIFQMVRDKKPASGWKFRSHAVRSVFKDGQDFVQEDGSKLSVNNDTLDKWLADMPDAELLFPKQKRNRKK